MRDILIIVLVLFGCVYTFKKPYFGVLVWSWLGYMNPHRLAYGVAYDMPLSQVVAIILVISIIFSRNKITIPINKITILWILFILLMGVTTIFAYFPENAKIQFLKVVKIQLILFFTMMLIDDMEKLRQLLWVITLSIGFYSIKGGIFTIASGGGFKVWGPPGSFIEDNNGLAVAVLMVIPMMVYFLKTTDKWWIKCSLYFSIITSLFTVLGSQSRGALLAIVSVAAFFWFKSRQKIFSGFIIIISAFSLLAFMPESWYKRMDTIQTYEEDGSAMGRINAWEYAFNAANDNFFGMGFESWTYSAFLLYAPNPNDVHAAHSIYFTVLGDHGWGGLTLFILIFLFAWKALVNIIIITDNNNDPYKINFLSKMIQVSFIAYFVGGAFLSLSYFDLPWHIVSLVVILNKIVSNDSSRKLLDYSK
jgi:putative inorganic carbon (HCO3(-)) transporter